MISFPENVLPKPGSGPQRFLSPYKVANPLNYRLGARDPQSTDISPVFQVERQH